MPEFLLPYTDVELTQEVNRIPNRFGLLNAINLAPSEGKASKYVRIDIKNGVVYVLSAEERGAPGQIGPDGDEGGVILQIPHFPHLEKIGVGDVDGVLQVINGVVTAASIDAELERKLVNIRGHHSITREFIRLGMLKGEIKDGRGRTLYDLFDVFDITKKVVDFGLDDANTNVMDKVEEVIDHMHENVLGETVTGYEAVVSPSFFSKFVSHTKVEKFWVQAQNAALHTTIERQRLAGNWGRVFEFGELRLREYKGSLPIKSANGEISNVKNIADDRGHAFPTGTQNMFRTYDGPVYHMSRINQAPNVDGEGEPIFISTEELKHGEGYELKSQSNMLAICRQPECLVELTA
ncbi:MAG TPA: major capsid protein [Pseudorhizobium sp.]|nr:major capsid protein [Pseudorhizobium sp.]